MKPFLAALLLPLIVQCAPMPAAAHAAHHEPSVYMVGDSITELGTDDLRALGADWQINAKSGRLVTTLPDYLRARLEQKGRPASVVVVALGANASANWKPGDYRQAIRLLPKGTKVVLVTVYRDPSYAWDGTYEHDASHTLAYTQEMQRIAAERPHTCLARWRSWASAHPKNLWSGVHPGLAGQKVWAQMVYDAVRKCT